MTEQKKTEVFKMNLVVYIDKDANNEPEPIACVDCEFECEGPQEAVQEMLRKIIKIRDDNPKATDLKFKAELKDSKGNLISIYADEVD